MTPIKIFRIDNDLPLPKRAHPTDAGLDIYSSENITLQPGERHLVGTGLAMALPVGTVGLVHPRSGLAAKKGLSIVNAPGTIDAAFRGEVKVNLINLDPRQPIVIERGERIAQIIVQEVLLNEVEEVSQEADLGVTDRGKGGHGSTGTN